MLRTRRYRFEVIAEEAQLRELGQVWRALAARTPMTPFGLPGFFDAWRCAFANDKPPFLVVGFDRSEPDLIVPLWAARETPGRWSSLGAFRADYTHGVTNSNSRLVAAFWTWLATQAPCESAYIARCPADSALARGLPTYATSRSGRALAATRSLLRSGRACYLRASRHSDYPIADRQRIEQLAARLRSKNVKRKLGALSSKGAVSYEAVRGSAAISALLPVLFEMHISNFDETGRTSQFVLRNERTFYQALATNPELEGILYMDVLRVGNRVAALHLGFQDATCIYWYKPAYDREFAKGSPGLVLLAHLFARAAREQVQQVDLLKGGETYKEMWTNDMRSTVTIATQRPLLRDLLPRLVAR